MANQGKQSARKTRLPPAKRSGEITRQRIQHAALKRFAEASYDEVGLRDIAADVGVDVALVHRTFGSKKNLFLEVFSAAASANRLLDAQTCQLGALFAQDLFETKSVRSADQIDALQLFVRSLSSSEAKSILRSFALQNFVEPLALKLRGRRAAQRAALFTACLIGVGILRDMLQIEPLQNRSKIDSRDIVAKILDTCLQGAGDNCSPEPESSSTVAESAEHEGRTKSGGSRRDA